MSLILDGTNGLSDVDGSAATPAIRGSDANTGVFFGADQVGIATNGVERVEFGNSETVFNDGGADVDFRVESDTDANALFVQGSDGNVGIGTSSPGAKLEVSSTGTQGRILLNGADLPMITNGFDKFTSGAYSGAGRWGMFMETSQLTMGCGPNGSFTFKHFNADSTSTERARIDSSGSLLVGTTSAVGAAGGARFQLTQGNANWIHFVNNTNTSGNIFGSSIYFSYAPNNTDSGFFACGDTSAERLRIYANGGIANYSGNNVNLSDRREKTNFAPAKSYLNTICAIPVQTFNYIDQNNEEDPGSTLGVVAQDVQEIAPELVMESNWGSKEEPKMRLSIYQTDLQYALMKCIQEQQAIITALTARVEALEGAQA
jgi:hypothetical protein